MLEIIEEASAGSGDHDTAAIALSSRLDDKYAGSTGRGSGAPPTARASVCNRRGVTVARTTDARKMSQKTAQCQGFTIVLGRNGN
jgi:hypothetical protein